MNKEILASFRSQAALELFRDRLNDLDVVRSDEKWRKDGETSIQATARIAVERIDALIEALQK